MSFQFRRFKLSPARPAGVLCAALVVLAPWTQLGAADSAPRPPATAAKRVDPALRPVPDVPGRPRVLLIGDSISMGYTLPVRELLAGKATVHRPPENCSATATGLRQLDHWLGSNHWDVIHFNFGLHDLKYLDDSGKYVAPAQGHQVAPLPVYEKNLRALVTRLKATGARLIWCSTTPVPAGTLGRVEGSEAEYNRIAAQIMQETGVAVDDLHAFVVPRQTQIQLPKNVHFTADGYRQLAAQVTASIAKQLP